MCANLLIMAEKSQRLFSLTLLRVVTMLFVVWRHAILFYTPYMHYAGQWDTAIYGYMAKLLHAFNMPMFVFLSGFLYCLLWRKGRYAERWHFLWEKVQRLLVPYVLWGILIILLFPRYYNWSKLLGGELSHLWFLTMLFGVFLVVTLLRRWLQTSRQIACWMALFVGLNMLRPLLPAGVFALRTVTYLPYFLLGMWASERPIRERVLTLPWWLSLLFFAAALTLTNTLTYLPLTHLGAAHGLQHYLLFAANVLAVFVASSVMVMLLERVLTPLRQPEGRLMVAITYFDKGSMTVYLVHHIVYIAFLYHSRWLFEAHPVLMPLTIFFGGITASLLVYELLRRSRLGKLFLGA